MNYFALCPALKSACCYVLQGEAVMIQDPGKMHGCTLNDQRGFMLRNF